MLVEMAANATSFAKAQRNLHGFLIILQSAACEWFLLLFLLIDGVFSFLLTKFAIYCNLQIPCILCSRLDRVLGNEKPGFYRKLLCTNHVSEVSSLISCHIHGKLADGHDMCEECLWSFRRKSKPNPGMQRFLVGNPGFSLVDGSLHSSSIHGEFVPGSMNMRLCSCCNVPIVSRQNAQRMLRIKSPKNGINKSNIHVPRRLAHRETFSGSAASCHLKNKAYNSLSHVGYSKLKISSDSESDFPFSDDDEGITIRGEMKVPKDECIVQNASDVPAKIVANDIIHDSFKPCKQLDSGEYHGLKCVAVDVGNNLGEHDWKQSDQMTDPLALPEFISLDDFPPSSNMVDGHPIRESPDKCVLKFPVSQSLNHSALTGLFSHNAAPEPFERNLDATRTTDKKCRCNNKHENILKSGTVTAGVHTRNDEVPSVSPDISIVWSPNTKGKGNDASDFMEEKAALKEPERFGEESKIVPPENALIQGVASSSTHTIPTWQSQVGESHAVDACSSNGVQMFPNSFSIERTESSGDESLYSEIEGENTVDRLKQRIEYDKKRIHALYLELEEERNASAIAANQAMAMITRLQEEKAALHMEGLQYLRMMEEQAEYDVDALEKANDLLAEKEKEIQDLEAELEYFRLRFPEELGMDIAPEGNRVLEENSSTSYARDYDNSPGNLMLEATSNSNENAITRESPLTAFKDEKLFTSHCLDSLERKVCHYSYQEYSPHMFAGENSEGTAEGGHNEEESLGNEAVEITTQMKEDNSPLQKDLPASNGSLSGNEAAEITTQMKEDDSPFQQDLTASYDSLSGNEADEITTQMKEDDSPFQKDSPASNGSLSGNEEAEITTQMKEGDSPLQKNLPASNGSFSGNEVSEITTQMKEDDSLFQKDSPASNGSLSGNEEAEITIQMKEDDSPLQKDSPTLNGSLSGNEVAEIITHMKEDDSPLQKDSPASNGSLSGNEVSEITTQMKDDDSPFQKDSPASNGSLYGNEEAEITTQMKEDDSPLQKDSPASNGSLSGNEVAEITTHMKEDDSPFQKDSPALNGRLSGSEVAEITKMKEDDSPFQKDSPASNGSLSGNEAAEITTQIKEDDSPLQKDSPASNGSLSGNETSNASTCKDQAVCK